MVSDEIMNDVRKKISKVNKDCDNEQNLEKENLQKIQEMNDRMDILINDNIPISNQLNELIKKIKAKKCYK